MARLRGPTDEGVDQRAGDVERGRGARGRRVEACLPVLPVRLWRVGALPRLTAYFLRIV